MTWFWKIYCNVIYVETAVLHAELLHQKWTALMNRFNENIDSFKVLIIMYAVFNLEINLNRACCQVIIVITVINASLEVQTWIRVV